MTIDQLRNRRRELLARKKYELELQAAGNGDNLALFMVQEELLDVNSQIRALMPSKRIGSRKVKSDWASEVQQYKNWSREETSLDDEIADGHSLMIQAMKSSMETLTPRQKEIFACWQDGRTFQDISEQFGIDKSTVSRTVGRAKKAIREESEIRLKRQKIQIHNLDMSDRNVSTMLLSALTTTQAVYLYLYYSEYLSIREIGRLTGVDHSAIHRTIHRALRNIDTLLGYQEITIENMECLDELAYAIYCEIQANDTIVPQEMRPKTFHGISGVYSREKKYPKIEESYRASIRFVRGTKPMHSGQLYSTLLEKSRSQTHKTFVISWLKRVFSRITGRYHAAINKISYFHRKHKRMKE